MPILFKIGKINSEDGKMPKVEFRKFENSIFNYRRDEKPLLPQIRKSTVLHETTLTRKVPSKIVHCYSLETL